MASFPFSRYPYQPYHPPYRPYSSRPNYETPKASSVCQEERKCEEKEKTDQEEKNRSSKYNSFGPVQFQNPFDMDTDEPILDILGIPLYLDDLIILGLLFFLYKEEVKDEMLFLSLVLLLIT